MIFIGFTEAVVSKGFDGQPAVRFSEGERPSVSFRIGATRFDKRVEGNYRWINMKVRAFGEKAERIRSMKLDAGSRIAITGEYDEEHWEDNETKERKSAPVLIVEKIEYCYSGNGNGKNEGAAATASQNPAPAQAQNQALPAEPQQQTLAGFSGYAPFGSGANPFFNEG